MLLNGEENSTRAHMQAVIDFETKLANITTPSELRRDEESIYNLMTIAELQDRAPFVSKKFFIIKKYEKLVGIVISRVL